MARPRPLPLLLCAALAVAPAAAAALPVSATLTLDLRMPAVSGASQPLFDAPIVLQGEAVSGDVPGGFTLPAGAFAGSFDIPGPVRATPVTGVSGSLASAAGSITEGPGGLLGGSLGLTGGWQLELFAFLAANLPLTPIGVGGSETVLTPPSLEYRLDGGAWTTGTVSVSIPGVTQPLSGSGFDARDGDGLGAVRLVSPLRLVPVSAGPSAAQYAAIVSLDLVFVPEPGSALLVGIGLLAFGALRRAR